jgi:5-methylcytosine-specific restriction protein B
MSESQEGTYTSTVRLNQQMMEIVKLLAGEPDGLQVKEVIRRLKEAIPPTEQELTLNSSGAVRYDTNVRWWSVGLVKADYITKEKGIWRITDVGRQALVEFPTLDGFAAELDRRYQVWKSQDDAAKVSREDWSLADAVLARVPEGRWVSAGDLGKATGFAPTSVGIHVWQAQPARWHVVLRQSGELPADLYGVEDRSTEQRALLAKEGIQARPTAPAAARLPLDELLAIAKSLTASDGAWMVRGTSIKGGSIVSEWLSEGFVSIPASRLPTLAEDADDASIKAAVDQGYDSLGYSQREAKVDEIRAFMRKMRTGDLVLTTVDEQIFVGCITSSAYQVDSPALRSNMRRDVEWLNVDSPSPANYVSSRLDGRMRSGADVIDLTDLHSEVASLAGATPQTPTTPKVAELGVLSDEVVEELLIDPAWLQEFVELLRMKKQVILYGPPGTGKTFLAQEVAEALAGKGHVTLVQFHPSYAYEDFFEGYRPAGGVDGGVSLQLVPGPFRKVVDLARANPSEPYFLIIDEINRANLAKVFGELYFLLEYRDRSIELLYSSGDTGPAFSLPANVYIIGTMNTADRSIALVDAAMRRRFGFLSLHPEDERLDLVLRAWLAERGLPEDRADLLVELNRRITDKDFKIGPSYLMNSWAADDAGLERIWKTSILPLLEEYHVGEGLDVEKKYGLAALRSALMPIEPVVTPQSAD